MIKQGKVNIILENLKIYFSITKPKKEMLKTMVKTKLFFKYKSVFFKKTILIYDKNELAIRIELYKTHLSFNVNLNIPKHRKLIENYISYLFNGTYIGITSEHIANYLELRGVRIHII